MFAILQRVWHRSTRAYPWVWTAKPVLRQSFEVTAPGGEQRGEEVPGLPECWLCFCCQRFSAAEGKGWAEYFTHGYEKFFSCHITRKTKHKRFLNNEPVISTDFSRPTSRLLSRRFWNFARSLEFFFCHFLSLKKENKQNVQLVSWM